MADFGKLKQVRNAHRTNLKRLEGNINTAIESAGDMVKLDGYRISLESKMKVIQKLDTDILGHLTDDNEIMKEVEETSIIEENLYGIIAKIDSVLKIKPMSSKSTKVKTERKERKKSDSSSGSEEESSENKVRTKLPEFKIPHFYGDPVEWRAFWDQFKASIHDNKKLGVIHKYNYLRSYLHNAASACIEGLTLTEGYYVIAVDILKERFGNTQVLIRAYTDALAQLPKVDDIEDLGTLRVMYDKIQVCVRNLTDLGVETSSYGSLLISIIFNRMPEELRLFISRRFKEGNWTLDEMLKMYKEELSARERCKAVTGSQIADHLKSPMSGHSLYAGGGSGGRNSSQMVPNNSFYNNHNDSYRNGNKNYNNENYKINESNNYNGNYKHNGNIANPNTDRKPKCIFCKSEHKTGKCNIVTEVAARKEILKKEGRCFVCLQKSHVAAKCPTQQRCRNCNNRHNPTICDKPPESSNTHVSANNFVLLQCAVTAVHNPKNISLITDARILFDSASQRTYITTEMAQRLKLTELRKEPILIKTFMSDEGVVQNLMVVELCVRGKKNVIVTIEALCIPLICSPLSNQYIDKAIQNNSHLQNLELAEYDRGPGKKTVDMLVGLDFYYSFINGRIVRGEEGAPIAVESNVGYIICGPMKMKFEDSRCNMIQSLTILADSEYSTTKSDELKKVWEESNVKIVDVHDDEDFVYEEFKKNIKFDGERYETKLPLKPFHRPLPDNYHLSLRRLFCTKDRLDKDQDLKKNYNDVFTGYLEENIIERVTTPGVFGQTHYLPHHPIVKQNRETTKVRPVFDGSAKIKGNPSLNECLYSGPCLLKMIFSILLRFRMYPIGLTSDIKQAFLNVGVTEEHRDFMRFLWFEDVFADDPIVVIYRFTRVLFGLICSPFLLNGTIEVHVTRPLIYDPEFIKKFLESLYVDDSNKGVNSKEEGIEFYKKAKSAMKDAGLDLRKWASNSKDLMRFINEAEGIDSTDEPMKSVLGLQWNTDSDTFQLDFTKLISEAVGMTLTKRNIFKYCCKVLRSPQLV